MCREGVLYVGYVLMYVVSWITRIIIKPKGVRLNVPTLSPSGVLNVVFTLRAR